MATKTPVSLLQEVMMQSQKALPVYSFTQLPGLVVEYECTVVVGNLKASAKANSKQKAKHLSAQMALKMLGFNSSPINISAVVPPATSPPASLGNAVGILNELASQNKVVYPTYTERMSGSLQAVEFTVNCEFGKLQTSATAGNKKEAKQKAAKQMLRLLEVSEWNQVAPVDVTNTTESKSTVSANMVDSAVIDMFKKLSVTMIKEVNRGQLMPQDLNPVSSTLPCRCEDLDTVDKIKEEFARAGVTYTVELFQKQPLILMLKIKNTGQTIMEMGSTYDSVMLNLLKKSLTFYRARGSIERKKI